MPSGKHWQIRHIPQRLLKRLDIYGRSCNLSDESGGLVRMALKML